VNPGYADPAAAQAEAAAFTFFDYRSDNLVARRHGQLRRRRASFDFVQFGVADSTGFDADQYLTGARSRGCHGIELQGR
jgi:hypothetical protein